MKVNYRELLMLAIIILLAISNYKQCKKECVALAQEPEVIVKVVRDSVSVDRFVEVKGSVVEAIPDTVYIRDEAMVDSLRKEWKEEMDEADGVIAYLKARLESLRLTTPGDYISFLPPYKTYSGIEYGDDWRIDWEIRSLLKPSSLTLKPRFYTRSERISVDNTKDRGLGIGVGVNYLNSDVGNPMNWPVKLVYKHGGTQVEGVLILDPGTGKPIGGGAGITQNVIGWQSKKKKKENGERAKKLSDPAWLRENTDTIGNE